jgi:hypothetical protein
MLLTVGMTGRSFQASGTRVARGSAAEGDEENEGSVVGGLVGAGGGGLLAMDTGRVMDS